MTLHYEVKFLDYWHLSAGLSAGAKLDSTVVKDKEGLPYLSGKTLKGLVREMAIFLDKPEFVESCFGTEGNKGGDVYFSNATLTNEIADAIKENSLQERLYDILASTKINQKTGVAQTNSLREIEVVVPLTLVGTVEDIDDNYAEDMSKALQMVKRMGLNRTRGLGRCEIQIKERA
jgi:CRISPR/Cas system CSM-associated protein Csm3 (group 7 of RAMP superfamily)